MRHYLALIHKDPGSDFGVSFPDLPGCVTAAPSLDEARVMAEDALALHLAGMAEDGEPFPAPSELSDLMTDRAHRDAVAILVPVKEPPGRVVRVNVTFADSVLRQIDAYAEANGLTRSGFLALAATKAMTGVQPPSASAQARTRSAGGPDPKT